MTTSSLRAGTLARLDLLHARVVAAVDQMRREDPAVGDPLRGLYISDDQASRLARRARAGPTDDATLGSAEPSLAAWGDRIGIDAIDLDLLLVAAAPDLDRRYEQLFGYLHDDVTRRRASTGLALRLTGHDETDPAARRRFHEDAPLVRFGLIEVGDVDRPFLTRAVTVPDRVVAALIGDDTPARSVQVRRTRGIDNEWTRKLASAIRGGVRFVHLHDRSERTAVELAVAALVEVDGEVVVAQVFEQERSAPDAWTSTMVDATREAAMRGCGLIVDSLDPVLASNPGLAARLAALPRPVILVGRTPWESDWCEAVPLALEAPQLQADDRERAWNAALGTPAEVADGAAATAAFRLGPVTIRRAADAARLAARYRGGEVSEDDLRWGARQQNTSGLRRLARRIEPSATWNDLVLTAETVRSLREISARVRHRTFVLDDWAMRRGGGRGDGITALFAGPSGTGKTLAAEVIAHELGIDLHTVDLATVVDKYIGETEKNLDRIFNEAEQVNTVLFFDEADALFGKRSEVKDARDRYANVEVAYLLQRMERFDGLVVLATNLRLNIDDAFSRRLDVTVDFPRPGPGERLRLWLHLLGNRLPVDDSVDLTFLAQAFEMSGGDIRNAVVTAAYLAADEQRPVGMADLVRGVAREYRKLGRLCLAAEFKEWFDVIDSFDDDLDPVAV